MELKECITCGSHSFTCNKCDYCGNEYEVTEYEVTELYDDDKLARRIYGMVEEQSYTEEFHEYLSETRPTKITFEHGNKRGDEVLRFMFYSLLSIIWFAVTVFIPPLFLITICGLIIWICRKVCKKY